MSKMRWLALAVLLVLASPAHADGIDIKVKGEWDFAFGWNVHSTLRDNKYERNDDHFLSAQRVRTQINFITSEYLQAVLMFEIGDLNWGSGNNMSGRAGQGAGGGLDADGVNVETKRAYLDWIIPNTDVAVRMGIQGLSLPMSNDWTNPVFSADVAGITVSYEFNDMFGLSLFWARPFDQFYNDSSSGTGDFHSDEMDMFGLILPVNGDGWSVTPWGMYARIGNSSGYHDYIMDNDTDELRIGASDGKGHANAWWLGLSTEISILDPLTFSLDAMYGQINKHDLGVEIYDSTADAWDRYDTRLSTKGWFIAAALNYELDWATPGIFGWYASGDDYDDWKDGELGRLPVVGIDDGWAPTTFGFPGTYSIGSDTAITATGMGTWGIGIQLADISFIEDLSHTIRFAYYRGTNDDDIIRRSGGETPELLMISGESHYLTRKDYVLEVNFDHSYQIYENLTAVLELGWLQLNLDDGTWANDDTEDGWKAQLMFNYSF